MPRLSAITSRAFALFVLAALCAAVYVLVVEPVVGLYRSYDESMAQSRQLLDRYGAIASGVRDLEAALADLRDRRSPSGVYLKRQSDALAAAELHDRVKGVIEASGGGLKSIQALPVATDSTFVRVAIRVQMQGGIDALNEVFFALESGKPFIFLENVDIRSRQARRKRKDQSGKGAGKDVVLSIRFDAYGYMPGNEP